MPGEIHTHKFKGVTVYINGHLHLFSGTSSASPNVAGHTHYLNGNTTINNGHSHPYSLITRFQTDAGVGHYHYYEGITGYAGGGAHPMSGTTTVLGE